MSKISLNFRTNVLLKNIIGQDLINNDNIAILELVKNSFDAGSKSVKIEFSNLKDNDDKNGKYSDKNSQLLIQDFGSGMTKSDIIDKWLNIAYSEKKEKKIEFGRLLAGAKGIGRFSCDRLGRYLDIYTKTKNEKSYLHLFVDWTKFEIEGEKDIEIQDIPIFIERISLKQFESKTSLKGFTKGTVLKISNLRTQWTYLQKVKEATRSNESYNVNALLSLRRYLERLINPNQAFGKKNKFEINIFCKDFINEDEDNFRNEKFDKIISGKIENKIFKQLQFKATSIESSILNEFDGPKVVTILKDKGREIYRIVEKIEKNKGYSNIEDANVIIYFLNTYSKIYFAKETGQRSVEFGSIFLFKNGFRVSPYGDEGDDWLGLEVRKGQGQRRFLGTRDIVGRIEIKDNRNVFREVTSREGLVNNEAFAALKEFFYVALKRLEKFVVEGLKWDSIPSEIQKRINKKGTDFEEELFQLSQEQKDAYALEAIRGIIKTHGKDIVSLHVNSEIVNSLVEEQKEKFESFYNELEKIGLPKVDKNMKSSLEILKNEIYKRDEEIRRLKSNSVIVNSDDLFQKEVDEESDKEIVALQHHINQSTERIRFHLNELRKVSSGLAEKEIHFNLLDRISFENKKISTLAKFVTKAKFNLVTAIVRQDIVQFIKEYVSNVYPFYEHKKLSKGLVGVVILMKSDFDFVMSFRPIDLIITIDNLLDNAQKAGATIVELSIIQLGRNTMSIHFKDNGKGLDSTIKSVNDIFKFGFTTSASGTGIGLYHVNSIVKKMKGTIDVNLLNKGIEFIITLNRN